MLSEQELEILEKKADSGCSESQYILSKYYCENGNYTSAIKYASLAVLNGYKKAYCIFGRLYQEGLGFPQDDEKALVNYKTAADDGHAEAQFMTSLFYLDRNDYDNAMKYADLAISNGYKIAHYTLGQIYHFALGVAKDEKKAFKNYKKAADNGYPEAQFIMSLCYLDHEEYDKAKVYAEQAISNGNKEAHFTVGRLYQIDGNDEKAFVHFKEAADNGHFASTMMTGNAYFDGIGVEQSDEKAFYYLKQAAENARSVNDFILFRTLGDCYADGIGTIKNIDKAVEYYTKAYQINSEFGAELGLFLLENKIDEKKGIEILQECIRKNVAVDLCYHAIGDYYRGIPGKEQEAFKYYQLSYETSLTNESNGRAAYSIGYCYLTGVGTEKSIEKAIHYFKIAAEKGNDKAYKALEICHMMLSENDN